MLWQDKFSLGIPVIDEQHKQLVDLVEEVKGLIHDAEDGESKGSFMMLKMVWTVMMISPMY
ncbi:MAG: hypothetical protein CVV00_12985 [Firmicutes bacterium HGW-Firmicutes-5]|nr:MAG: hypothetical protein CVV00_12985 [Firmicutes bacterium HGW-Firmicutes-5]